MVLVVLPALDSGQNVDNEDIDKDTAMVMYQHYTILL